MKFFKNLFKKERKKEEIINKASDFFPQDENVEKYSELLKEATALKKINIVKAVELIRSAILILKDYPISFKRQGIKKLADYERINGNIKETISILHDAYKEAIFSNEYFMRAMEASIFISYIVTQTKKMKIETPRLELESDKLHIVALAVQGRIDSITSRIPQTNSNIELKEFLDRNINKLSYFQRNITLTDVSKWKNNEKMNQDFFSIINEIDNRIENILICVANSISRE